VQYAFHCIFTHTDDVGIEYFLLRGITHDNCIYNQLATDVSVLLLCSRLNTLDLLQQIVLLASETISINAMDSVYYVIRRLLERKRALDWVVDALFPLDEGDKAVWMHHRCYFNHIYFYCNNEKIRQKGHDYLNRFCQARRVDDDVIQVVETITRCDDVISTYVDPQQFVKSLKKTLDASTNSQRALSLVKIATQTISLQDPQDIHQILVSLTKLCKAGLEVNNVALLYASHISDESDKTSSALNDLLRSCSNQGNYNGILYSHIYTHHCQISGMRQVPEMKNKQAESAVQKASQLGGPEVPISSGFLRSLLW